jgi:hypothetical protein
VKSKRHAKPTALQLAERTYRKVMALSREVADLRKLQLKSYEAHLPLIDHCARLLREKETLQRQLYAVQELKDSSPCAWRHSHRLGVRCGACGHLEISEDNYNPNWHKPDGEL